MLFAKLKWGAGAEYLIIALKRILLASAPYALHDELL